MKAPRLAYCRPGSLREALDILGEGGGGAVPLAGGQSLLASLNMRLSSPELLVDIGELAELRGIALDGDVLKVGAATRHAEVADSALIREHVPLIASAIAHVGHVAIRNRGTFGGSLAFADPAAELPACAVALAATIVVAGRDGRREIAADVFFKGLLQTDLRPGELIVEIRIPARKRGQGWAFFELSRRHGDFAIAGLAVRAALNGAELQHPRFVYFGCVDYPKVAQAVGGLLRGRTLPLGRVDGLAAAIEEDLDPPDTPGCMAATKRHLAGVLTRRALAALHDQVSR